ncbi:MAG: tRNA-dihydrouridine synthase, partial [Chitinophagaceae bacterium]|nr:tRNA-dihydrouridine synthase [Rubrivivax sp.]
KAMRDATPLPVTVKHRIGVDRQDDYGFVRDFVGTLATQGGCEVFIVHARSAWLQGLSPKENRELPPLRHDFVARLKADSPALTFVANGGIQSGDQIALHLQQADGVMVGRHAYHEPWAMAEWDQRFFGAVPAGLQRDDVERAMVAYLTRRAADGYPWTLAARHMLGLWNGTPGARRWRQVWSDHRLKQQPPAAVQALATAARLSAAVHQESSAWSLA